MFGDLSLLHTRENLDCEMNRICNREPKLQKQCVVSQLL